MTGLTNNVQQWDLFAMHVANVTTTPKYVDRSPQKYFQMEDDNDNSKAKTQETHNNQHREKKIGETGKCEKLKMSSMLPTMEIEARVPKAAHQVTATW
jgi:hypothetical protein